MPVDLILQPLRIPAGWSVAYNNGLWEIDPVADVIPEEERWLIFKEDMLQLIQLKRNRLLDLGWSPEGDLILGQYKLVVYEGDFRGRLLHEFKTVDRLRLVEEIERLLVVVNRGEL